MFRAGGSFGLLSARNVALLWVRLHSDLSTAVRRDNSGLFGTRRAMPAACNVQVRLFLVRSLGRVTVDIQYLPLPYEISCKRYILKKQLSKIFYDIF